MEVGSRPLPRRRDTRSDELYLQPPRRREAPRADAQQRSEDELYDKGLEAALRLQELSSEIDGLLGKLDQTSRAHRACARPSCRAAGASRACARCEAVYYCSKDCAKRHWREHKRECQRLKAAEAEESRDKAKTEAAIKRGLDKLAEPATGTCAYCGECDNEPLKRPIANWSSPGDARCLVRTGCACAGVAHVECALKAAKDAETVSSDNSKNITCWHSCAVCAVRFEGYLGLRLASAFWRRNGDDDYYIALNNVASFLQDCGELKEATRLYERAAKARADRLGPTHALAFCAAINLAETLCLSDSFEDAVAVLQDSAPAIEAWLADHPDTKGVVPPRERNVRQRVVKARLVESDARRSLSDLARATSIAVDTLATSRAWLGEDDVMTLRARRCLARAYEADPSRLAQARACCESALADARRVLGPRHPQTAALDDDYKRIAALFGDDASSTQRDAD